ncbi:hypothetical protein F4821DRAFT_248642 [Hypoxylon rubiginosum]|uniref:Uncharacterized protein n=1 Tax=Hypoxylon rubiginosum TaxID=110542 RepID=A0ACC0CMW1_9PEZI|nr:hypothetical protein F4821DRAFT_248642 [Hypoxylon rubiginosum]
MMVQCQRAIRPKDARQYRQRSVSVLPRSDPTQDSTASNNVESSAGPLQLVLSRNTYERLAAARRAQDGLTDQVRAEALAMKERQQEELRIFREFRELAEQEKRQQEEALRQLQLDDLRQRMLEFETLRAIEEEERAVEVARRRETEALMRDEAIRQRQAEQNRILAERIAEEEARVEEERIRIQEEEQRELIRIQEAEERERIRIQEAEERERIRRERFRECAVCMEEDDMGSMIQAPCAHWYCREDLQTAFHNALNSRQPFRCCSQEIPVHLFTNATADFRERYDLMMLELRTPNPLYCSNRACGVFLPPTQYQGPDNAACRACRSTTCRMCRNPAHSGICPQDVGMQQATALAAQNGWRRCPRCSNMVEKISGCDHMTCRCRAEFSYTTGADYNNIV